MDDRNRANRALAPLMAAGGLDLKGNSAARDQFSAFMGLTLAEIAEFDLSFRDVIRKRPGLEHLPARVAAWTEGLRRVLMNEPGSGRALEMLVLQDIGRPRDTTAGADDIALGLLKVLSQTTPLRLKDSIDAEVTVVE